jgi:hypothetical protein
MMTNLRNANARLLKSFLRQIKSILLKRILNRKVQNKVKLKEKHMIYFSEFVKYAIYQ